MPDQLAPATGSIVMKGREMVSCCCHIVERGALGAQLLSGRRWLHGTFAGTLIGTPPSYDP